MASVFQKYGFTKAIFVGNYRRYWSQLFDFSILPKKEVVVYCPMTQQQSAQYYGAVAKVKRDKDRVKKQNALYTKDDMLRGSDEMRVWSLLHSSSVLHFSRTTPNGD